MSELTLRMKQYLYQFRSLFPTHECHFSPPGFSLVDMACSTNMLQLHSNTLLLCHERCLPLTSSRPETLITFFILLLEAQICWWSWPEKHDNPVLESTDLSERSMPIILDKFVGVQILSGGFPSRSQPQMVTPKASRVRRGQQAIYEHGEWNSTLVNSFIKRYSSFCLVPQAVSETGEGKEDTKDGAKAHKGKEIPIISSPNAIVDPHTMMVLGFYAAVTYSAVVTSRRPPKVTGLTILCGNVHCAI